ncbi:MAG: Outer membrane protein transport protein (OMPP1/FadL/TodX) [Deltaproteobacteria bacterium ADurb.Bin058]|nr:MAG: Outer membrane protein transport protein (OMPP1/FadL/TodX) [Deltaproteobacteria bacterium ADurb.Bin058]
MDFTKDAQANQATVDVKMNLAPVVGIMVEPIEGLTIGFNWRCANNTYISIPVTAILSQKIEPVRLKVTAYDYSTPHQIALGAGYKGDNYRVSGDITYSFYKSFNLSTPEVTLFDAGGGDKVVQQILPPSAGFKNTFAVRFGGEYSPLKALAIRAGFGWVQSPVPAQTGVTNLLDGDRFTGSFGLGFDAAGVGGPPIAIDFHLAYGWILENRDAKTAVNLDNPGYPYVSGKGGVLNSGLTFKVRF